MTDQANKANTQTNPDKAITNPFAALRVRAKEHMNKDKDSAGIMDVATAQAFFAEANEKVQAHIDAGTVYSNLPLSPKGLPDFSAYVDTPDVSVMVASRKVGKDANTHNAMMVNLVVSPSAALNVPEYLVSLVIANLKAKAGLCLTHAANRRADNENSTINLPWSLADTIFPSSSSASTDSLIKGLQEACSSLGKGIGKRSNAPAIPMTDVFAALSSAEVAASTLSFMNVSDTLTQIEGILRESIDTWALTAKVTKDEEDNVTRGPLDDDTIARHQLKLTEVLASRDVAAEQVDYVW